MDIRELTDDELEQRRLAIGVEIERRQKLESIPAQIADLTARYVEAGGNPDNLSRE